MDNHRENQELTKARGIVSMIAQQLLRSEAPPIEALKRIADQSRQAGALDVAASLYRRISTVAPLDARAKFLERLLTTGSIIAADEAENPIRFRHLRNFLPKTIHSQILDKAIAALPDFGQAKVFRPEEGGGIQDDVVRQGQVHKDASKFGKLFLERVGNALMRENILSALGVTQNAEWKYELQLTNYGDGDFYGPHRDNSSAENAKRKISFVYYFRRTPNSFMGGDLLLYDRVNPDSKTQPSFTRVSPEDISIVFFPSNCVHEVTKTIVPSTHPRDGRFTLNAWVLIS
ncbi:MAG: 2OG-Fe(II) oxygenase [Henriciella sp.]|nr:2OG-Fe(II) oxygenase [Henriciella sp.]